MMASESLQDICAGHPALWLSMSNKVLQDALKELNGGSSKVNGFDGYVYNMGKTKLVEAMHYLVGARAKPKPKVKAKTARRARAKPKPKVKAKTARRDPKWFAPLRSKGWTLQISVRQGGATAGTTDTYFFPPGSTKKLRSHP